MLTALLCAAILALCVVKSRLPAWIAGMLACVNLLTFFAYAADKAARRAAAGAGRPRTPCTSSAC
ncbi:hypothetical protein [Massilia sp. Dwa41.01b]|uniref:hypothetical protein n=1 Tax=Massilia sp. Dwa41.01b TaxID=2709302 RepID=UPI001E4DDB20|nr:hypothetical protein [Massilia sp. Dwa41.01b]